MTLVKKKGENLARWPIRSKISRRLEKQGPMPEMGHSCKYRFLDVPKQFPCCTIINHIAKQPIIKQGVIKTGSHPQYSSAFVDLDFFLHTLGFPIFSILWIFLPLFQSISSSTPFIFSPHFFHFLPFFSCPPIHNSSLFFHQHRYSCPIDIRHQKSSLHNKMIGQQQQVPHTLSFKKGMTLDEYLSEMDTISPFEQTEDKAEEDLYQTSKSYEHSASRKMMTYEIRESEEDEYEESHDDRAAAGVDNFKLSVQLGHKEHRMSNKNILLDLPGTKSKDIMTITRGFRVRKQSNSPFNPQKKDILHKSPNKNFALTLFANSWKSPKQSHPQSRSTNPSTTLYNKFLKVLKQPEQSKRPSKQKYFHKKNTQEIEHLLKYERDQQMKQHRGIHTLDMRVEGFTDRLYERKSVGNKGATLGVGHR